MKSVTIEVKIGKTGEVGSRVVKCEKLVWGESDILAEDDGSVTLYLPKGYDGKKVVDLVNYAEDLKRRAACRQSNTDEGGKPVKRQRTMRWMVNKHMSGDSSYWNQYQEIAETDVKSRNEYLDELYENTEELSSQA